MKIRIKGKDNVGVVIIKFTLYKCENVITISQNIWRYTSSYKRGSIDRTKTQLLINDSLTPDTDIAPLIKLNALAAKSNYTSRRNIN